MLENYETKVGPVVSVLIPTFNRPRYLSEALASALRQSYRNLQVIIVNDGGEDVSGIVNSFSDPRIIFINRKENYGKAFSLNEALDRAEGKYIAYLDDDDLYYPNHIETLVDVLENKTNCHVAYSDLYKKYCKVMPDGSRQVLSKVVNVSRDFDRFFMLYFNHVLHVSLMHRRDLIEKTGLYKEQLNILIDWD
ncbi:MAG: glycosyltransferase family 2 protein, partial [Planctomycetota bacterium]